MPQPPTVTPDLLSEWSSLSRAGRLRGFQQLRRDDADDFFLALNAHDQAELILEMPEGERRVWMRLLAPDDAADLIQQAPSGWRESKTSTPRPSGPPAAFTSPTATARRSS